jgi:fatty-acyl-CoA synthase
MPSGGNERVSGRAYARRIAYFLDEANMTADAPRRYSPNKDWLRALQATADLESDPRRTLPMLLDAAAATHAESIALIDAQETLTFSALQARAQRIARWALAQGWDKGDAVALLMENRADYLALWLGLTRVGVTVALLNTALPASALAHCVTVARARALIVSAKFAGRGAEAAGQCDAELRVIARGEIATESDGASIESRVTLDDCALLIFTSGTTGLPKAAIVSHRRLVSWALWFKGLIDATPGDRMYNCLPLYHSVGGVVAVFPVLLAGGAVVLRERFSASAFWDEVIAYDCTLFQYIGELCRYLVTAPQSDAPPKHRLRLCVGNGLRKDVWEAFQSRFSIPRILEFYAATESNFSLYNVEGEPGSIGRAPAFLAHRFPTAIVAFDVAAEEPLRDDAGFCRRCSVDETGEAIARIPARGEDGGAAFEGYLDRSASEKKVLRHVFEPGDAWMRSGDLMRKDSRGFYYFVDRIGDTFRWKGENVSTFEAAQALSSCPGVLDATMYGVAVPGHDGRAGMAALSVNDAFDLSVFARHVVAALAPFARPLFLRLRGDLSITETFKHRKQELAQEGFDPARVDEALYFFHPERHEYIALDEELHRCILSGAQRL